MWSLRSPRARFVESLVLASAVSTGLFLYGVWRNHSWHNSYLIWNLTLAWLPLLFALVLMDRLRTKLWSSWECLGWSVLWLLFLPNSFYLISDFIHLQDVHRADILYDAVMFTSFIYTGVILGYSSLYLVHTQLQRRLGGYIAARWIAVTLLLSSVAIYIGRDLRWNSWDVVTNPGGLLFDVFDRIQNPAAYPQMLLIIGVFWVLLGAIYYVMWRGIALVKNS
jgi:uncharacterized membrane protein